MPPNAEVWPCIRQMEGGIAFRVRPIRPDDAGRERAFIMSLSPESRFQRLMYTLREPSAEFVARLVTVDQHRDMALVATLGDGAEEQIIGVARYSADESGPDCEFAVAVADAWQCRGIGTTLARMLFDYAAGQGFRSIYGRIFASNQRMLELAEWLGLTVELPEAGQTTVRASRRLN